MHHKTNNMKHLFFLLLTFISLSAFSQSAIAPLDASGSGVTGGDGTGKIVSAVWTVQNPPATVTYYSDAAGTQAGTNQALKTYAKITAAGTYNFTLTVTDNLGNTTTGNVQVIAYGVQTIEIKIAQPVIKAYLK
jgi:hypothetical protein